MVCVLGTSKELFVHLNHHTALRPVPALGRPRSLAKRVPSLYSLRASPTQLCINADEGCLASMGRNIEPNRSHNIFTVHEGELQNDPQMWERLRDFPKADLVGKVVLVRCDLSAVSVKEGNVMDEEPIVAAVPTISCLVSSGARIVIASHWSPFQCSSGATDAELIADCLSRHLDKRISTVNAVTGRAVREKIEDLSFGDVLLLENLHLYKEEVANDKEFSKDLTEKIDILVNDAFSISHRVLASTVGAACFTSARLAGLQLERELIFLTKAISTPELPFVAIVGGSKLSQTLGVLYNLLKKCSSIVVTGSMVYTFFNALGHRCPSNFIENVLVPDVLKFMSTAATKRVDIILPVDFLCVGEGLVYKTFRADNVPEGWHPVSLGRSTLKNIENALLPSKMALWIGPVSLSNRVVDSEPSKLLARTFGEISKTGCLTIVGGREATFAVRREGVSSSISHISRGGAAFMEFLRGVNLPAVAALDFACPDTPIWEKIYKKPHLPLFVDIGCGNGLFILKMARDSEAPLNFLGLEIRKKLVDRCLTSAMDQKLSNVHFVEADAATMFKRIVSNYPGNVAFVAIQCPVPNFLNVDTRRRMVQKQLVEQVIHILPKNGKIFLQSDVKSVAVQLRQDFLEYGNGCVGMSIEHKDSSKCDAEGWLLNNPYGVSTDWEDHVLQRGDRMYRVLLSCL